MGKLEKTYTSATMKNPAPTTLMPVTETEWQVHEREQSMVLLSRSQNLGQDVPDEGLGAHP
jgi:hypothetical protein